MKRLKKVIYLFYFLDYEQKCIEIERIKREYQVDAIKQLRIYIDKLQK